MKGQPFFFDENIFDDDSPQKKAKEEIQKPEFTKNELEHARQEAFDEGKKAGFKDSETGKSREILSSLEQINRTMDTLLSKENARNELFESEAVHLSLSVLRILFPLYYAQHGDQELEDIVVKTLRDHKSVQSIDIRSKHDLSSIVCASISERMPDLVDRLSFASDERLSEGECRILWPDGGVILNRQEIAQKIFTLMEETLAERGITVHDDLGDAAQENLSPQDGGNMQEDTK